MDTSNYSITIGTVTYAAFPTYGELNRLRPDVTAEIMILFRMLGLCSVRQINIAIGNEEGDFRVQHMLTNAGVADKVNESQSDENRAYTLELQEEILGDDKRDHILLISDAVVLLQKIAYSRNSEKALKDLLKELKNEKADEIASKESKYPYAAFSEKTNPVKPAPAATVPVLEVPTDEAPAEEVAAEGAPAETETAPEQVTVTVETPTEAAPTDETPAEAAPTEETLAKEVPVAPQSSVDKIERDVLAYAKACDLSPTTSFQEAKKSKDFFPKLLKCFPDVTCAVISTYLFGGSVSKYTVQVAIREAGASRGRGLRIKNDSIIERCAFVAWAGGDWRSYYNHALSNQLENTFLSAVNPSKKSEGYSKPNGPTTRSTKRATKSTEPAPSPKPELPEEPQAKPDTQVLNQAAAEPPCDVDPKPLVEAAGKEPEIAPAPEPKEVAHVAAEATIVVSGSIGEILQTLSYLEKESTVNLVEFYVKK